MPANFKPEIAAKISNVVKSELLERLHEGVYEGIYNFPQKTFLDVMKEKGEKEKGRKRDKERKRKQEREKDIKRKREKDKERKRDEDKNSNNKSLILTMKMLWGN